MSRQRVVHAKPAPIVARLVTLLLALFVLGAIPLEAQILDRIKRTAQRAAEDEVLEEVDRRVRSAVRCAFNDLECIERAEAEGHEVELVDEEGRPVPVETGAPDRPGEGAWANYDFVPGDEVLFFEDFTRDAIGDFPRRLEFVRGNWDVVELGGRPLLRNTGPRHSAVKIPLPRDLPERFTIEFAVLLYEGNANLALATAVPAAGPGGTTRVFHSQTNYIDIGSWGVGVTSRAADAPKATQRVGAALTAGLVPIRILADGRYVKVYVDEQRVANVPNATLDRSNTLWLENTYAASEDKPIFVGPIRVAAGGRDLYDVLEREGRVATQGIYFDTGSDRLRPESTPTLAEIARMLADHPELRIGIEGHTDSVGDDSANQTLSERRAAAVRQFLLETHGVEPDRLESRGHGETRPVADNDTPEGRQQNRRVELVRL